MINNQVKCVESVTLEIKIYIAGNVVDAERICRKYCAEVGFCVTVTPTKYIYTGGAEDGVIVGLMNYPRFPCGMDKLLVHAEALGTDLMEGLYQSSYSIVTPCDTFWYSRRSE